MLFFYLHTSWILFGATSFRPGLPVKFEKRLSFVLQGFLLKVDIFLLNRYSFCMLLAYLSSQAAV